METPGKQNSPDEELADEVAEKRISVLEELGYLDFDGGEQLDRINVIANLSSAILAALRKSKAGQEKWTEKGAVLHELAGVPSDDIVALARLRMQERERAIEIAKAGQVEEEGKGSLVEGGMGSRRNERGQMTFPRYGVPPIGKPEAVADHAQAVLRLNTLLHRWHARRGSIDACETITRDYKRGLVDATGDCSKDLEELLSTQGVGEEQELGNEALPASTQATVATPTDSTPRSLLELLPCPFCGMQPESEQDDSYYIFCDNSACGCSHAMMTEAQWNQRAAPSVVAGVGEHAAGVSLHLYSRWKSQFPKCVFCGKVDKSGGLGYLTDICPASPQVEQVSAVQEKKDLGLPGGANT